MATERVGPGGELTLEEFEALPDDGYWRDELSRGRVVREPPAGTEHGGMLASIAGALRSFARERGAGKVVANGGFVLARNPATVRAPDVAFVRAERIPAEASRRGYWHLGPDLAVEVVSPSNTVAEIQRKVLEYLEAGTTVVWVVEPRTRTVAEYRPHGSARIYAEGEELRAEDILPGFAMAVTEVFEE